MASVQLGERPVVRCRTAPVRVGGARGGTVVPISAARGWDAGTAADGPVAARTSGTAPVPPRRDGSRRGGRLLVARGTATLRPGHRDGARRTARSPRPCPPRAVALRPAGRQQAPPLRLTRRGRRLVAGLVMASGICLALLVAAVAGGGSGGLELAGDSSVVVRSGDTLWSIAGTVAPEEDRRAVVDAVVELNRLDGVGIVPGQVLQLP